MLLYNYDIIILIGASEASPYIIGILSPNLIYSLEGPNRDWKRGHCANYETPRYVLSHAASLALYNTSINV